MLEIEIKKQEKDKMMKSMKLYMSEKIKTITTVKIRQIIVSKFII